VPQGSRNPTPSASLQNETSGGLSGASNHLPSASRNLIPALSTTLTSQGRTSSARLSPALPRLPSTETVEPPLPSIETVEPDYLITLSYLRKSKDLAPAQPNTLPVIPRTAQYSSCPQPDNESDEQLPSVLTWTSVELAFERPNSTYSGPSSTSGEFYSTSLSNDNEELEKRRLDKDYQDMFGLYNDEPADNISVPDSWANTPTPAPEALRPNIPLFPRPPRHELEKTASTLAHIFTLRCQCGMYTRKTIYTS